MTSSSAEKKVHTCNFVAKRNGVKINVGASHRLTARVVVGMLLLMLSGCVTSPTYTISPPKPKMLPGLRGPNYPVNEFVTYA